MDPVQLLEALRRRWPVLLVLALLGGAVGAAHSVLSPARYEASTTVFLALDGGGTVSELAQGSTYTQSLAQSFAEIATLPVVLGPAARDLDVEGGVPALERAVSVEAPEDTSLVQVTVSDESPRRAASLADAVAGGVTATIADLAPEQDAALDDEGSGTLDDTGTDTGAGAVLATTVEPAVVPTDPVSLPLVVEVVAGLALGALAGAGVALLAEVLAAPVRDRTGLRRLTTAPVLAEVPRDASVARHPVSTRDRPDGARADAVRVLRTNVRFLQADGSRRVLVVAGATGGSGATSTAVDLAAATAEIGLRVLLVDADLRSAGVADALGLAPGDGLPAAVLGDVDLRDAVQRWGDPGVDVLVGGHASTSPSELLASPGARRLLEQARDAYDLVVLDAPPLLGAPDAAALAALGDGAVVVLDARRGSQRQVSSALERLELAGAEVLGVVLTGTSPGPEQVAGAARGVGASAR